MIRRPLPFHIVDTPAEPGGPALERRLHGDPRFETLNHYTDPTGQFFSGVWSGGVGAWRVVYSAHEEEFCQLLEGEVLLTDADGAQTRLKAGDAFVVPGGYEGVWENLTPVKKLYAIMTLKETP
jgi:uncharacterized cupin superfamily protein